MKAKLEATQKYAESIKNEISDNLSSDEKTNVRKTKKNKKRKDKSNGDVTSPSQGILSMVKKEGVKVQTANIYDVLANEVG